ncbi:MAG: hypothetical protein U9R25_08060 [Chloroflexota bacterium]|nr:hypothetical protein [Chloroflexota bacterium]
MGTDIASVSGQLTGTGLFLLIEVHNPPFHRQAEVTATLDVEPGEHVWPGHPADLRVSLEPGYVSIYRDDQWTNSDTIRQGRGVAYEVFIPREKIPYAEFLHGMWIDIELEYSLEDQLAWQAPGNRISRPASSFPAIKQPANPRASRTGLQE